MKKRQAKKYFKDSSAYRDGFSMFQERATIHVNKWYDSGFWRNYRKALTRLIKCENNA